MSFFVVESERVIIWYYCYTIQKKIIRAFKFLGFKIEVSSNNKIVTWAFEARTNVSGLSKRQFIVFLKKMRENTNLAQGLKMGGEAGQHYPNL